MLALAALTLAGLLAPEPDLQVRVDRRTREVVLTIGPFDVPGQAPGARHSHGSELAGHDLPLFPFAWPVSGWGNGFRYLIRDGTGRELPRQMIHHLNVINRSRRQLVEPVYERTFAIGQETGDVQLPPSIGVRLEEGSDMAVHLAFENPGTEPLKGVTVVLRVRYLPGNMVPGPRSVNPVPLDVAYRPGGSNSFDLPPGMNRFEREFVFPISGRMLALGAHLHDHARSISLTDVETGRVMATLQTRRDSLGRVRSVEREIYGIYGQGLRIRAGRRYRVTVEYENPSGQTIELGGMGILGGLFMADRPDKWPAIDRSDPGIRADEAMLARRRSPGHYHAH